MPGRAPLPVPAPRRRPRGPRLPPGLRVLRLLAPLLVLGVVLVVLLGGGLLVAGQFTGAGGGSSVRPRCDAAVGVGDPAPGTPTRTVDLGATQRTAAATIVSVARSVAAPPRAWVVAVATAMQESRLGLAGTDVAVDHDSLGLFQQRPSQGWGTPAQVRDPVYATRAFLGRLLAVDGWERMPVTRAAQTVQRSAFPSAYARWEPLAADVVGVLGGPAAAADALRACTAGTGAPAGSAPGPAAALPGGLVDTATAAALAESGKPYVWGGTGPDVYDCSGLVQHAFAAAGVVLPRTSREQYRAGAHVALADARAGDLLFWAYDPTDPDTVHHVAISLGGGRIVEAQRTGVPLGTRAVSAGEDGLVPLVTRPGTAPAPTRS